MPIDLPPALPPQLAETQKVIHFSSVQDAYVRTIDGYEMRVTGDHTLRTDELDELFNRAQTPSQAILLMNAALYNKGLLLVRFLYSAPREGVIYVHALQTKVGKIRGDAAIAPYFKALQGDPDLTRGEFDRRRALAKIRAERVGVNYGIRYEASPSSPNATDLIFEASPRSPHDATDAIVQVGNQGSRFVGRYFVDLGFKHDFSNGTRFAAGYETAITEWGESRDGDDYQQVQVQADHPFSFGLYGIEARHTQYERDLGSTTTTGNACPVPLTGGLPCPVATSGSTNTEVQLDAEIKQVALTGGQILRSDLERRLTLSQRLEWTDSSIEARTGETLQDERYAAAALGTTYHRMHLVMGKRLNWKAGASLKAGLSSDSGTLGTDDTTAGVSVGKRTAEFLLLEPRASVNLDLSDASRLQLSFTAQLADEQLPQQQQWVLGGIDKMSAYLPGVVAGDTGYHLNAQYRYSWELGFAKLEAAGFAEYGSSQFENASGPGPGIPDLGNNSTLVDAGVRATLRAFDALEVSAVIAESLAEDNITKEALERAEADFFLVVKATF